MGSLHRHRARIEPVGPAVTTLRERICKVAKANSSGRCTQDYLDRTRYSPKQVAFPPVIDWCAFYAAWVWRQAGLGVYFKTSPLITEKQQGGIFLISPDKFLGASGKLDFLKPGDIIVFQPTPWYNKDGKHNGRNHHAIIIEVKGTIIDVVEGNFSTKTNVIPPQISEVHYTPNFDLGANHEEKQFYSVETFENPKIRF